jgi:hypothetical protein
MRISVLIDRFDKNIFCFQAVSRGLIGQVRNPQMDRSNPCKTGIIRVQGSRHRCKSGPEPIHREVYSIGAVQEAFDLRPPPYRESNSPPLDQRRASQKQAVLGAGNAQIAFIVFAQMPDLMHMAAQIWRLYT